MEQVTAYLKEQASRFEEELKDLLRIPSVSAKSEHRSDMLRAAEYVKAQLEQAGCQSELVSTKGHPIVYGERLESPGAPTVLIYGHYDVQPPEPLQKWTTPPFEPTVREGKIYARGATDDKGQMFTHLKSVEAWTQSSGSLPVNVKFVIEGEEEVGSNNLDIFLSNNRARLKADIAVISDTSQYAPGYPAITYGLRGILACEIFLQGPSRDLHSGMFGGSVANPANMLARMLAALHNDQGKVQIPGFYDDVVELTQAERDNFAALPFNEKEYLETLGTDAPWGEVGYTSLERRWARPTCDVNGMISGYTGEGPKTIVPAEASAKITCRLVPNQNAAQLTESLKQYLESILPPGIRMQFKTYHGCKAWMMDLQSPWLSAARSAIAASFGTEPVLIREGGSIPVVTTFKEILGIDSLMLGWGQDTDNLHSPDEHFSLDDFHRGIHASAVLWRELAGMSGKS